MPVQSLEEWAASRIQTGPLSLLKEAVIGIDAWYYLDLRINKNNQEPLLHALGGTPYCLKKALEEDLQFLRKLDICPIFVFNGLDFRNKEQASSKAAASLRAHEEGWQHYLGGDAEQTVADFTRASFPVEMLYKYLQKLLFDNQIQFMVAPYSAAAQLSYLDKLPGQFIDTVLGSTDMFLFQIDKIITNFNVGQGSFEWLTKAACQERLEKVSDEAFRDAQLLLGSAYLPTFPPLDRGNKKSDIRDALNLVNTHGRSVLQMCNHYRDDSQVQQLHYADRYKKAIMTIRHHVVLETNGKVIPLDFNHAPGDVHEFIGQRLPEELLFYISKGMLGPQVPNWITSGEIVLSLPPGCEDSEDYRRLMADQLNLFRTQSLSLLSNSLHRYYQTRSVSLKTWYDSDKVERIINLKELPSLKDKVASWKVHKKDFPESIRKSQNEHVSLAATLRSFQDTAFVQKSMGKPSSPPLQTKVEVIFNVQLRFLQLRGFINEKHELTAWGKALKAAISALDPNDKLDEFVLLAIEMMRLGLVHGKDVGTFATSAPRVSDQNKTMTILVSRVACFGRLKHKPVGYSGPLDRQHLTYGLMITAVRSSLRDLIETVLSSMCLNGDIDRNRSDWSELALSLPFISDNGCGLAIATRTYLDAVNKIEENPPSEKAKEEIKAQAPGYAWFQFVASLSKNLDTAFKLWDAVYTGSQAAGKEFKDTKSFTEANEWLSVRR